MRGMLLGLWLAMAGAAEDPASVLILVNRNTMPEPGTGRKGAGLFVGEHYAEKRGIPRQNLLPLDIPMCCDDDPHDPGNWEMPWARFDDVIRQPVKRFLDSKGLRDKIHYIVPTYGIPVRMNGTPWKFQGQSVDSFLAAMNLGKDVQAIRNPYQARPGEAFLPFREFTNPYGWKMYIVSRLDGPSAAIAAGLVDKAMAAEASLKVTDGIGYFDFQHKGCCKGDAMVDADQTMINAYELSRKLGTQSVLNDQSKRGGEMIRKAPRALWAWGWYSGETSWEGYEFAPGAVGAQLNSYSAANIRAYSGAGWVALWLQAGITATWGATGEPTVKGYAMGDNLLSHFWMGRNFGESAYLATPALQHMMVFVGDPLYAPKVFRK